MTISRFLFCRTKPFKGHLNIKHMKTNTVIQIRIIDPMGKKISASELVDADCSHPIVQAFSNYLERHRGELVGEWILVGEGGW